MSDSFKSMDLVNCAMLLIRSGSHKWDVDHTTAMLASTFKWRLDTNLDSLLENGDLGNGKEIPKYVENFEENGKVFSLGTNHKNQPVMYVQFGKHIIWAQPQATTKKCE